MAGVEKESDSVTSNDVQEPDQTGVEQSEMMVETENHDDDQEQMEQSDNHGHRTEVNDRQLKLPMSRVKTIIKMDPDVTLASQEAVVVLAKAAELFINSVSKDASYKTLQGKRKTLIRKDLEHIFDTRDCYAFLEGTMES